MARIDYAKLSPQATHALYALEKALSESPVGHTIINLVKVRASQLNGCLFCLDMHSKEAKLRGERELRLYHLSLWRESSLFDERERAALEWTELLTRPDAAHGISDEAFAALSAHFSEREVSDLTLAIAAINAWNRLGIGFRPEPGALDKAFGLDKPGLV
jgi:AhpD family alkylhydroperoxidase